MNSVVVIAKWDIEVEDVRRGVVGMKCIMVEWEREACSC